jgi:hypothetical protein
MPAATPDLWPACGHALLERNAQGWLATTPAWLAAWLQRPELALVPESCAAETALHEALALDPLRTVQARELAAFADDDARQNYQHFLAFRDALLAAGTLEAWLLALWRSGRIEVPPLFIDLTLQAVLRGVLEGCDNAYEARAAEMLFRPQRLALHEGHLLAGDRDTLDLQRDTQGFGDIGRLLAQAQQPVKALQLQVLRADNTAAYWQDATRPIQRHGFLLDLTHEIRQDLGHGLQFHLTAAHSGLQALARVLQRWVAHMLGVQVRIQPLQRIDDAHWRWHLGLDAQSSLLLDDLYAGHSVEPERLARLVSLFRLDFENPAEMRADVAGRPVYLGLATDSQQLLRLKPHNLLLNLPLAARS